MERKRLTVNDVLVLIAKNDIIDSSSVKISIKHGCHVDPVNLDQISINIKKEINLANPVEFNTSYEIIIDMENENWLRHEFLGYEDARKADDELEEEVFNDFVDMEESEEICNSNEINKEEYKLNVNDAVKSIKYNPATETLSLECPSEKDFCIDEWPGNKYIITPDQC